MTDVVELAVYFKLVLCCRAAEVVERRYVFLKRLCQVLCALGGQLCSLVVSLYQSIHTREINDQYLTVTLEVGIGK